VAPRRILVVEDSPDIRELWRLWLTLSGFIVDEAANGAEGVQKAREQRPDLVLMDLLMPVMDGVEAIQCLRAHASTADVAILAITAVSSGEAAQRARAAGADACVSKPLMPEDLLIHMQTALDRRGKDHASPDPLTPGSAATR